MRRERRWAFEQAIRHRRSDMERNYRCLRGECDSLRRFVRDISPNGIWHRVEIYVRNAIRHSIRVRSDAS